jgi:hypothetical protein
MLYSNFNKNYFKFTLSNVLLFIAISSLEVFRLYFLPFRSHALWYGPGETGQFGSHGSQDSAFASPREEGPDSATSMGEGRDSDSTTMETSTKANITVRRSFIAVSENQNNSEFIFG